MPQVHFVSGRNIFSYVDCRDGTYDVSYWNGGSRTFRYQNVKKEFSSLPSSFQNFRHLVDIISKMERGYENFNQAHSNL